MEGWVKLYRKLINNKIWSNPVGLKVWLWCLLKANHKDSDVLIGFKTIKITSGQFVFGRLSASEELGISPSTTRNWMSLLKQDSYLDIKTTNKFSIVTINKWNEYQDLDSNLDSKIKTKKKQNNTNNNVKNEKNILNTNETPKQETKSQALPNGSDEDFEKLLKPNAVITQDWQYQALDIIDKLQVPVNKKSAFFKACKEHSGWCETALRYAIDFPNPKIRWNMFFVKYTQMKNGTTQPKI